MANPVKFKLNLRGFNSALSRYELLTKRDAAVIVNTKAFYIARAALAYTPKADSSAIRRFFGRGNGEVVGKIINKRRGERGEKGLYGKSMQDAALMMRAARLRSVAFLKSGWLPAIKTLAKLAEKPSRAVRLDRSAKEIGRPKGSAIPASGTTSAIYAHAIITNLADARHDDKHALETIGGPALQRAVDHEEASMREYIERKLVESAHESGFKAH